MTEAVWAVVPAAGIGSRFSSSEPKQYAKLAGKTLLEHALQGLLDSEIFTSLTIGTAHDDERYRKLSILSNPKLRVVNGGASRAETVLKALQSLRSTAQSSDWVMVHDAARPLVSPKDIHKLYSLGVASANAAILAKRATDTVKQSHHDHSLSKSAHNNRVASTLDRETVWLAQTPQMARFGTLLDCLENLDEAGELAQVTDEASVMERFGHDVMLVESSRENFKVTRPEDLVMAEAIFAHHTKET